MFKIAWTFDLGRDVHLVLIGKDKLGYICLSVLGFKKGVKSPKQNTK